MRKTQMKMGVGRSGRPQFENRVDAPDTTHPTFYDDNRPVNKKWPSAQPIPESGWATHSRYRAKMGGAPTDLVGDYEGDIRKYETSSITHKDDAGPSPNVRPRRPRLQWPGVTIGNGLEVSESLLHDAGMGLFATMDFFKGDVITIYEGEHIDKDDALTRNIKTHMASICSRCVIDGIKSPIDDAGGGSFVNDPRLCTLRNATFRRVDEGYKSQYGVNLIATRDILSGEEIYASYGNRGFAYAMPDE